MVEIHLKAGEFNTLVRFYKTADTLLDGTDLQVFDGNTAGLFPSSSVPRHVWPTGEGAKVWPQIDSLLSKALELGLARDSTIAGVGGGVVTDMAAFAASLYMRGCRLVLVPTTLLAMVDAALGGKTGVDYGGFKNLVGTFYPAHELRIWPGALQSLPERDFRSGLAEVIKHGFLADAGLLDLLENRSEAILSRDSAVLDELVYRAVMVKVGVVERDFRETGERAFLNLGHTFGHALESVMGFDGSWTHGEAVCWGMGRAFDLGVTLGKTDPVWRDRADALMALYGFRSRAIVTSILLLDRDGWIIATLALLANLGVAWVIVRFSPALSRLMGRFGTLVIARILWIFIAAIGAHFVLTGISEVFGVHLPIFGKSL